MCPTEPPPTPREQAVEVARRNLVERYRDLGYQLLDASCWLRDASVDDLLAAGRPVPYLHSGARDAEEALDAALTAL